MSYETILVLNLEGGLSLLVVDQLHFVGQLVFSSTDATKDPILIDLDTLMEFFSVVSERITAE